MEEVIFEIQGSAPRPYRVVFIRRSQSSLSAYCTCPAGENGQCCKHRLTILDGTQKNFVSANPSDVKIVQTWLAGTDVETIFHRMRSLEKDAERIKKELSAAKSDLARAMRD